MNKQKLFTKIFLASMMLSLSATGLALSSQPVISSKAGTSSLGSHSESVSLTNSSFNDINSTYSKNDVTGWKRIKADGSATMMIIDTVKNYSVNQSSVYYLSCENPGDANKSTESADNKILMINSALKSEQKDGQTHEGYRSNEIKLNADSYYTFQIAMKTDSFNEAVENGSIYISGLKDEDDKDISLAFERVTTNDWTNYYFFLDTGSKSQTVTIDLWLGSQDTNSYGVAFFDEIYVNQLSENLFYDRLYENHSYLDGSSYVQKDTTKYLSLDEEKDEVKGTSDLNLDFEEDISELPSKLSKWSIAKNSITTSKTNAKILNILSKESFENEVGKEYPGSNYKYNNKQSLVLWSQEDSSIMVESQTIPVELHGYYKISMYVKTNLDKGSFYVKVSEQEDIFSAFPELEGNYTLHSATSSAIKSSGLEFDNGYQVVDFYVEGNNLYNSSIKIQLALGSETEKALGYAVVDDISIEYASASDFSNASNKLSLAYTADTDLTIKNGFFNQTSNSDGELTYPLSPANWTVSMEDKDYMACGIVNTYKDHFDEYRTKYSTTWGNVQNPAQITNSPANENLSNNVLMFWNAIKGYQSIKTSEAFSVSANSYYEFSLDLKTYGSNLTLELINDEGVVLYSDSNVNANGAWEKYKAYIYTGESSHSVNAIIHFGTKDQKESGYAFIDNVKLTASNQGSFDLAENQIDLSNLLLNLDAYNKVNSNISDHSAYAGSKDPNSISEGGVIIGNGNTSFTDQNNNPIDKYQDLPNNVLVISVYENSNYTLKSLFGIDVEADKYYSLKFKLLTNHLPKIEDLPEKDEDGNVINYNYGVSIGLSNFEKVTKLSSNDGWTEFTIYFKATEAKTVNFEFSLISDHKGIYGTAFLTDLVWQESDEETYNSLENKEEFNKTIFSSTATTTDDSDQTPEEGEPETPQTPTSNDINWLLIPSIIMAVAVVIAVVGSILRKIKIGKKSVKKEKGDYDRKETLDKNVIKLQAQKIKESEIKSIEQKIKSTETELTRLEEDHKEYISQSRKENNGKITKEIEKSFKAYSAKRSKLIDKIASLKEELSTANSPEYLLSLEKKVTSDAIKLKKQAKAKTKQKSEDKK